jgi:hypothetical protein
MSRQPSAEPRRTTVTVKLSGGEAAEVDRARGTTERATWLRETALRAARGQLVPAPARTERQAGSCKHEGLRLAKGVCPDCRRWVTKK